MIFLRLPNPKNIPRLLRVTLILRLGVTPHSLSDFRFLWEFSILMFARTFGNRAGTAVRYSSSREAMPLRAKVTSLAFAGNAQVSKLWTELGPETD